MSRKGRRANFGNARGLISLIALVVAGVAVGWLSFKSALVGALPANAPGVVRFASNHPDVVLSRATSLLIAQRGVLEPGMLVAVQHAAMAAPLDARGYLILGHQQLLDAMPQRALATLEAGQRLDPRHRLIHLLLLDRYLRTARYANAATQFSVLARLMGGAQPAIATAMAQMIVTPETRDAVRRTLRTDPGLERAVLVSLARSNTSPATVFELASPIARAEARQTNSWGPVLVNRLIDQAHYATARSVWQKIYGISAAQAAIPIINPDFRKVPATPPFDWIITASGLGAADLQNGRMSVEYYGRDSGDLATQLLVLRPGRYRYAFTVDPGKTDATSRLFWSLACGSPKKPEGLRMNVGIVPAAKPRRIVADLVIPSDCPVQTLTLRGEADDFPAPIAVELSDLDLRPTSTASSEPTS